MNSKTLFVLVVLTWGYSLFSCTTNPCAKINGVSLVASNQALNYEHIAPVQNVGANYAAVMPFGFLKSTNSPDLIYNSQRQWFGETLEGTKQYIKKLHENNLSVMLKPQLWVWKGEYTGEIKMETEADWLKLEKTYEDFILDYAEIAQQENVQLLCIGTELASFVKARPDYWRSLIEKIRKIYFGKLTYAANWDAYTAFPHWELLDYIGVDAYFPLTETKHIEIDYCMSSWSNWKNELENQHKKYKRPILFTEYGYRSVDFAGKQPWDSSRELSGVNSKNQEELLSCIFQSFWNEPWFAGGFLWKWFTNHSQSGGETNTRFTPQNKPAEKVIKARYDCS